MTLKCGLKRHNEPEKPGVLATGERASLRWAIFVD
jgi:hypothetical protein